MTSTSRLVTAVGPTSRSRARSAAAWMPARSPAATSSAAAVRRVRSRAAVTAMSRTSRPTRLMTRTTSTTRPMLRHGDVVVVAAGRLEPHQRRGDEDDRPEQHQPDPGQGLVAVRSGVTGRRASGCIAAAASSAAPEQPAEVQRVGQVGPVADGAQRVDDVGGRGSPRPRGPAATGTARVGPGAHQPGRHGEQRDVEHQVGDRARLWSTSEPSSIPGPTRKTQ